MKIKAKYKKKVAPSTIRKHRRMLGYRYRRVRKSPYLNDYHKLLRLLWCKRHEKEDFSRHIFVDETKITIGSIPLYHWRLPEAYPKGVPNSVKYRQKINVWGGISVKGLTRFVTFSCNMNAELYNEIIAKNLIPYAAANFDNNYILHQDNDPKHTANQTEVLFKINRIKSVRAPAQSPDLNPMEMVWSELKSFVNRKLCKNYEELQCAIEEFRCSMTQENCQKYIKHLVKC